MIKAVLDTNVFVSSIFWEKGNSNRIVAVALDRKIFAFTSIEILQELEKVLKRDFEEPQGMVERQIALICEYANIINPDIKLDVVKDDPDDNKVLECAIASGSEYIVTGDKHLLGLKIYKGVKIVKPKDFLDIITG